MIDQVLIRKEVDNASKKCSFVEELRMKSRLLITGLTGYICEDCAQQAYNIVVESGVLGKQTPELKDIDMEKVPKPTEIKSLFR